MIYGFMKGIVTTDFTLYNFLAVYVNALWNADR